MVMQVGVVEVRWEEWWDFSLCWVFFPLVCLFIVLFVSGGFFVNQCRKCTLTAHRI